MPPGAPHRLDPDHVGDHVDRLFRAAWALCGDADAAEDLMQETYARVLARPRFLRHEDDLGYLLRALRNTHLSRVRQARRRPTEVALDDDPPVDGVDMTLPDVALDVGEIFRAIAALPAGIRDAIVAVDVAGLSYREAAAALGVKEATLTTRVHRARRRVARALSPSPATS